MKRRTIILSILFLGFGLFYFSLPAKLFTDDYSTVCYSKEGHLLGGRIASDGQWRFPTVDSLPDKYVTSLLTFEDERFYYHPGVDPISIARAIKQNIKAGKTVSGASTITMQTVRLARKSNRRSIGQKLIESILALRLECTYTKQEILNLYASHAPFGCNVVGISAASWRYFNRPAKSLTWAQAVTLAVLPNAPSLMHPGKNRQALKQKRDRLLRKLLDQGKINMDHYQLALMEEIPQRPRPLPNHAFHIVEYARKNAFTKTSVSDDIQQMLFQLINDYAFQFSQTGIENLSGIISDTETGEVLAYVGNSSIGLSNEFVDMNIAHRSSGSILKPFLHAAMIDEGRMAPKQLLEDTPVSIAGFRPSNYHKEFDGVVPADQALQRSLNIPAVNNLQQYGISKFINRLSTLGLSTITRSADDYGLSLILGGAEVKLWDLVSAYASMARSLKHFTEYDSRYLSNDYRTISLRPVEEDKSRVIKSSVFTAGAIWESFEAMRSLKRPNEEGLWEHFSSGSQLAWKTGTSYGHRDAWAIGVNPKYTIGVWVGNSDGEGNNEIVGVSTAGSVLFSIVNQLPKVNYWFDKPYDSMKELPICNKSGHLASPHCKEKTFKYCAAATERSSPCPYHEKIFLSEDKQHQVNSSCYDLDRMVEESWFSLPAEIAYYYKKHHSDYLEKPGFAKECKENNEHLVAILYPTAREEIYLPKAIDGIKQKLVLEASHSYEKQKLFWHLNEKYLGETELFHSMELSLDPGQYELMVMDIDGNFDIQSFSLVGGQY